MAIPVLMPALSPTMTEGTIAKWFKAEGDVVASGDLLAEIETDKATMELEAVEEGIFAKIIVAEGSEGVPVNQPIAIILGEGEDTSAADMVIVDTQSLTTPDTDVAPADKVEPRQTAETFAPQANGKRVFASPLARRLAGEAGLDLSTVTGSGPRGRIIKKDVDASLAGGAQSSVPALLPSDSQSPSQATVLNGKEYTETPHSNMRKVIARRLTESSRDIPHFFLTIDCEIDGLLSMRRDLNDRAPDGEGTYKISVNDFVVRATALAIKKVPMVNVSWTDAAMRQFKNIDISVAVATDEGLITPIIRNSDQKGLAEISIEIKSLAARARDGKLAPDEYQGGGFTISNLGMYEVKEFCAIINPPQSCILAIGAGEQRPIVNDNAVSLATVMSCTLSVDHRAVDGALGAKFLQAFKALIEDPLTMIL